MLKQLMQDIFHPLTNFWNHILSDPKNLKLTARQWKNTIVKLQERPNTFVEDIINNIQRKLDKNKNKDSTATYSLDEMLNDDDRDRLKNLQTVIKVSIESMNNHKDEMAYINNTQNKWTPHTFGMLELWEHCFSW